LITALQRSQRLPEPSSPYWQSRSRLPLTFSKDRRLSIADPPQSKGWSSHLSPAYGGGGSRAGGERAGSCQKKFSSDAAFGERAVSRDRDDPNAAGNHRKNLRLSLEASLRRLRTDYIDVYWVHTWDRHTPIGQTMRALDDEVRAARILYVGISDTPAWLVAQANTLAQWHDWTAFAGLQVPYSLLQRDIEREPLPMAEGFGMTVAAWSPLAGGILSGKFTHDEGPEPGTRIDPASITDQQRQVATTLQSVADDLGSTPSQVAIAWTRTRSPAIHPIIGARRVDQLLDNLGAVEIDLRGDAIARLEAATEADLGFPATFIQETSLLGLRGGPPGAASISGD
jgi:aryl-alcohol dehydrogenase-like predicted oxidoreductase